MTAPRALLIALFTLVFAAGAFAQTKPAAPQKDRDARKSRAVENCKANRGTDCDTAQGLKEWEMLERSRAEAVRDGAHRRASGAGSGTR